MKTISFEPVMGYKCPACRVINVKAQSVLCTSDFGDTNRPGANGNVSGGFTDPDDIY